MASLSLCRSRIWSWWSLERALMKSVVDHGAFSFLWHFHLLTSKHQGFKHVFTCPSSVDEDEPRATRAGNAYIHGMTSVTKASLAYIATQAGFRALYEHVTKDHLGSLCAVLVQHVLAHWCGYQFWNLLQQHSGPAPGSTGKARGSGPPSVVESVSTFNVIYFKWNWGSVQKDLSPLSQRVCSSC